MPRDCFRVSFRRALSTTCDLCEEVSRTLPGIRINRAITVAVFGVLLRCSQRSLLGRWLLFHFEWLLFYGLNGIGENAEDQVGVRVRSLVALHDKLGRISLILGCDHADFLRARPLVDVSCYVESGDADKILSFE